MITSKSFGKTASGEEVLAFTLTDGTVTATILNYGGTVQSILAPDKNGKLVDVILGYQTIEGYEQTGGYLGALIGRFGNRIAEGKLTVDGTQYQLYCNDRGNHLHGGKSGFDKKIWKHEIENDCLKFYITSPDGEENYPGTLDVCVTYTLKNGELKLHYEAKTDKNTAINLTNHSYFNLNGENDGSVADHLVTLNCNEITPTDENLIPWGGFRAVENTPFDFRTAKPLGRDIETDDADLKNGGGYDHCFMMDKKKGEYALFATVESVKTGIVMQCYTDLPAVQFYTGNVLGQQGKHGYYAKRAGFCLETQNIPNNVNVPEYAERGSSFLNVGTVYESTTAYRFTVKKN